LRLEKQQEEPKSDNTEENSVKLEKIE
jgi:hypothetical protein